MIHTMQEDARQIITAAIRNVLPDEAVQRALSDKELPDRVTVIAVGKAAWQMAKAAKECLGEKIVSGIVITKYDHVLGNIPGMICYEAGHPVPDENSFRATQAAIDLVQGLSGEDTVIFLLSGGGSALFEMPLIDGSQLQAITGQLLSSGADIVEINTIRKRLSAVKGGRFAQLCAPARVYSIVLSDILGDPLDMIASGPTWPDSSTSQQAVEIARRYNLQLSREVWDLLKQETPRVLHNIEAVVTGSVRQLCQAASAKCEELGYSARILTDQLSCYAKDAGAYLAEIAREHQHTQNNLAFIAGGETVVRLTGKGLGGRNQELALSAAEGISGMDNVLIFSVGSDGTDGPTDAAGGIVDGTTGAALERHGIRIQDVLAENDSYHALKLVNGLIFTGPTGTNVNDVAVVLIRAEQEDC